MVIQTVAHLFDHPSVIVRTCVRLCHNGAVNPESDVGIAAGGKEDIAGSEREAPDSLRWDHKCPCMHHYTFGDIRALGNISWILIPKPLAHCIHNQNK